MINRNLAVACLSLLAFLSPWWLVLPLIVGAILYYQDFFEGVVILLILDMVYGVGLAGWRSYFLLPLGGVIFILVVEAGRRAMLVQN